MSKGAKNLYRYKFTSYLSSIINRKDFWIPNFTPRNYEKHIKDSCTIVIEFNLESFRSDRIFFVDLAPNSLKTHYRFGPSLGHLWRTGPDISDTWQSLLWNIDINDEVIENMYCHQWPSCQMPFLRRVFLGRNIRLSCFLKNLDVFIQDYLGPFSRGFCAKKKR